MTRTPTAAVPSVQAHTARDRLIAAFLEDAGWGGAEREILAADASFRRYDRLRLGAARAVLMDAPPPQEDVRPFLTVGSLLTELGHSAPAVLAADPAAGLVLLEDFGDDTYTRCIARGGDEPGLYRLAVDLLVDLHARFDAIRHPSAGCLPSYDERRLLDEVRLLTDWYMPAVGHKPGPAAVAAFEDLWRGLLAPVHRQPTSLVLRDFHVDNIMLLPGRDGLRQCGLLDFQDAVVGPIAYDLVSLLEDARRDIAPELAAAMKRRYLTARADVDRKAFETAYAVLGAQRNLKIVGVFTRLDRRDGKDRYLKNTPRLWRLIEGNLAHPALAPLADWLDTHLPAPNRRVPDRIGGL